MSAVLIFLLILAVLLIIFTLQNSIEITIQLFFWEIPDAPLVLVLLSCVVIGYVIAAFYFYPRIWKLKKENKKLVRQNEKYRAGEETEEDHPEGIPMDDDDESFSFFKD